MAFKKQGDVSKDYVNVENEAVNQKDAKKKKNDAQSDVQVAKNKKITSDLTKNDKSSV